VNEHPSVHVPARVAFADGPFHALTPAYVGQDRRLHVWSRVPLYASARVAAYLG